MKNEEVHQGISLLWVIDCLVDLWPASFCTVCRPELYDVCIRADDDTTIQCHKCVLAARLEYFHSMLGSGWIEVSLDLSFCYISSVCLSAALHLSFAGTSVGNSLAGTKLILKLSATVYVSLLFSHGMWHYEIVDCEIKGLFVNPATPGDKSW